VKIINGITSTPKESVIKLAMQFASQCNQGGDYWEFGVYKGASFISAFKCNKNLPRLNDMTFVAFDSFEGLPELDEQDDPHNYTLFEKGKYSFSMDDFRKTLISQKIDINRVKLIPGWYDESLTDKTFEVNSLKLPAVIMVDCDLYSSTQLVLRFITKYIRQGTVIIFDDWFTSLNYQDEGEQRAVKEWLEQNLHISLTEYYKYSYHGISFIVNVKKDISSS
jgi:hypothetical protein